MSGGLLKTFWFEFRTNFLLPALSHEIWRVIKPDFYVDLFMPDKTWGLYRTRWQHSDPGNLEIMERPSFTTSRLDFRLVPQPSRGKAAAGMEWQMHVQFQFFHSAFFTYYIWFFLHILDSRVSYRFHEIHERLQRTWTFKRDGSPILHLQFPHLRSSIAREK